MPALHQAFNANLVGAINNHNMRVIALQTELGQKRDIVNDDLIGFGLNESLMC